jgi:hypothetical protein
LTPQQLPGEASGRQRRRGMHHARACARAWLGLLILVWVGLGATTPLRAWDDFGHMTVAAVAWQHLAPAARAQATELLRLNPDYPRWVSAVAPADQDVTAFLRAATWPDAIKHETGYLDDGERPEGPNADQNIGYEDLHEHRYWHYVDVPFSPDGAALPEIPMPNAATRIEDFRRVLADPGAPAALRSYDLTWVLHLVGDIHQPLHAVSRFTQALPQGDLGGNRIRLCAPPCRLKLHYFWDAALGYGSPADALALSVQLPTPAAHRIADLRVQDWLDESGRIARQVVYQPPIGPGSGPYLLTPAYRDQARRVARTQVALAGRRLAVLLNNALR